jgi:hypothetical protein
MSSTRGVTITLLLLAGLLAGGCDALLDRTILQVRLLGNELGPIGTVQLQLQIEGQPGYGSVRYDVGGKLLPGTVEADLPADVGGQTTVTVDALDRNAAPVGHGTGMIDLKPGRFNQLTVHLVAPDGGPDGGHHDGGDLDGGGGLDGGDADLGRGGDGPDARVDASDGADAPDGADVADVAGDRPVVVTGATCAEIRASQPTAADGEYLLQAGGDPRRSWRAYCADMDTTPVEYLPLAVTGYTTGVDGSGTPRGGLFANYSGITQVGSGPRPRRVITTFYDRLRIDPVTLRVDVGDRRFSRTVGVPFTPVGETDQLTSLPYAVAAYCWKASLMPGSAGIDLRGTGFAVDLSAPSQFNPGGFNPVGEITSGVGGQLVELHGGGGVGSDNDGDGSCGWMRPPPSTESPLRPLGSSFQLQLVLVPHPASCAEVKALDPTATDGDYPLFLDHDVRRPWTAFCRDMASEAPREYLPLQQTGADQNFASYTAGGRASGTTVRTSYQQLRIDPVTLEVDIADRTYASSSGSVTVAGGTVTAVPYGVAADCAGAGSALGQASIDLGGTPFAVKDNGLVTWGMMPGGGATYLADGRSVNVTGGGNCGLVQPAPARADVLTVSSSFQLGLLYRPLPVTCGDVKAEDPTAVDGDQVLYVDGTPARPWTAYCADMSTPEPREYLQVRQTGVENYSEIFAGVNWTGSNVYSRFQRLRIEPHALLVDAADFRFATSTGSVAPVNYTSIAYGEAEACDGYFSTSGQGNVDLRGTPFAVLPDKFLVSGALAAATTTYSAADQVVDLAGGGWCGSNSPRPIEIGQPETSPSYRLNLVYVDP